MPTKTAATAKAPSLKPLKRPAFRQGEVIFKFRDGAIPTKVPTTFAGLAKALQLVPFFHLLYQLHQQYKIVSIQPVIRDAHWVVDPLLSKLAGLLLKGSFSAFGAEMAQLLAAGRLLSFPSDPGAPAATAPPLPSAAEWKIFLSAFLLRFRITTDADAQKIIKSLQGLPAVVEYAELVPLRLIECAPNSERKEDPDPLQMSVGSNDQKTPPVEYPDYWQESVMGWDLRREAKYSQALTVAILDTGVDTTHPALRTAADESKVILGWSNYNNDLQGHGTHVCGILIASSVAGIPARGVMPEGSKVVSYKIVYDTTVEFDSTTYYPVNPVLYISALGDIAVTNYISAVNISMGGEAPLSLTEETWLKAVSDRIPIVAAAGNNTPYVMYPAKSNSAYAVGAAVYRPGSSAGVDLWIGSAWWPGLNYIAPGFNIYSTTTPWTPGLNRPQLRYAYKAGTSMAAPFVTAMLCQLGSTAYDDAAKATLVNLIPSGYKCGRGMPKWPGARKAT